MKNKSAVVGTSVAVKDATVPDVVSKHEIAFKEIAHQIITLSVQAGEKYLQLVTYSRANKLSADQVREWLLDCGFKKTRVSEINKLVMAPEDIFNKFSAKQIGWKDALQLTRGNIDEMKKVSPAVVDPAVETATKEAHAELVGAEESIEEEDLTDEEKEAKKVQSRKIAVEKGAQLILRAAAELKMRGKVWDTGTGFMLVLKKSSAIRKAIEEKGVKDAAKKN